MDDYAQFAQTCQDSASGTVDACGPKSPDFHRVVWGLTSRPPVPLRAFLRFPVCPLGSSPFARRPLVSHRPAFSGSFPSAVAQVPVPPSVSPRVPFPLSNLHVSAAARRFCRRWSLAAGTKVTSSAATTSPGSRDPPALQMAATGHDGMPPQNRLICAGARAVPSRLGPRAELGGTARSIRRGMGCVSAGRYCRSWRPCVKAGRVCVGRAGDAEPVSVASQDLQ